MSKTRKSTKKKAIISNKLDNNTFFFQFVILKFNLTQLHKYKLFIGLLVMDKLNKKTTILLFLVIIFNLKKFNFVFIYGSFLRSYVDFYNNNEGYYNYLIPINNYTQNISAEVSNGLLSLKLDLSNCMLSRVPKELTDLKNIHHLNLCNNMIKNLCELPLSLKSINLNNNKLIYLPEHFFDLINLKILNLSHNQISEFPKSIDKLVKLKYLDLSYNKITEIHSSINKSSTIESLLLSNNKIISLSNFLNEITTLRYIDLRNNKIIEFPDNYDNLFELRELNLSSNFITDIESICKYKKLKNLILDNNQIFKISNKIHNLKNLNFLNLSRNKILNLPEEIMKCKKLNYLHLSNNSILDIKTICRIQSLKNLYLNHNQIYEIPNEISNLKNLKVLHLYKNNISIIPESLSKCKKLKILYLSNNFISVIENICKIKTLKKLNLYKNQISEIPDIIGNLKNIKKLMLSENRISSLPKNLKKCKKLEFLFLKNNKINKIPIELLSMLSKLKSLDLRENTFIYPVSSAYINIFNLKRKMKDRLLIDDIYSTEIEYIYKELNKKSVRFNFFNLRKCRPYSFPTHIYSEDELYKIINKWKKRFVNDKYNSSKKLVILDPNEFTNCVKSFDTELLTNYIFHLYNPLYIYPLWNVPTNLINDFKRYIGAIVYKIFSSDDVYFVEGHLNSLSTAICYCPERQKNEIIFLYELLINEDEDKLRILHFNDLSLELGSDKHLESIQIFIEKSIRRLIGTAKMEMIINVFSIPENIQNVHLINYWIYMLRNHIGLDFIGYKPELLGKDKFFGKIELGLYAFYEKFTPNWLIFELKNLINSDNNLICKIAQFLFYSNNKSKLNFVECEDGDILFTKKVTIEFCEFILKSMEIIVMD